MEIFENDVVKQIMCDRNPKGAVIGAFSPASGEQKTFDAFEHENAVLELPGMVWAWPFFNVHSSQPIYSLKLAHTISYANVMLSWREFHC